MAPDGPVWAVSRESSSRRSRRSFVALAAAAVGSLAGCPGGGDETETIPRGTPPPSGTEPETADRTADGTATRSPTDSPTQTTTDVPSRFAEVVDITAVGGASDGSEPVTELIQEHAADDTLIEFPAGTYAIDRLGLTGLTNFGMRAVDGADVSLVPTRPARAIGPTLVDLTDMRRFLYEGIDLDFRRSGYGGMIHLLATDDFEFRNVRVRGQYPPDVTGFRFEVVTPDNAGIVENVRLTGGSIDGSDSVGIYVGHTHAGTLTVRDCVVENFPNNGLYASSPGRVDGLSGSNGPVHVLGGRFKNNNIANVRLGSTGSSVQHATIVVDEIPPRADGGLDPRGIRMRARSGQLVQNCEVRIEAPVPSCSGGIVVHSAAGRATVRNTSVHVDTDGVPAVNALRPYDGQRGPIVENVTVTGSASTETAIDITERSETRIRRSSIEQIGADRSGIRFVRSNDCLVADTRFQVTGDPIVATDSNIIRRNVSSTTPGNGTQ